MAKKSNTMSIVLSEELNAQVDAAARNLNVSRSAFVSAILSLVMTWLFTPTGKLRPNSGIFGEVLKNGEE